GIWKPLAAVGFAATFAASIFHYVGVGCGRSRGSILHPAIPAAIRFCARLSSIIYACRVVSTVSRIRC
ncbi:formate dehydrogenase N subunit beta transmembrane domain-containing protein, partial [Klebsiella pneumoniae]